MKKIKAISFVLIFIKLLIIWRITNLSSSKAQGHIWLGADGENYLTGVDALIKEGIFSKVEILHYWPAGYPLVIYFFTLFGKSFALTLLSIFQSVVFSFGCYFFTKELYFSRLRKFIYIVFFIISFNPTLALSSMTVGYESLVASAFLFILAFVLKNSRNPTISTRYQNIVFISGLIGFASFLQPRFLLTAFIIVILMTFYYFRSNSGQIFRMILISFLVVAIAPLSLILRNENANGMSVISTNLGVTMTIGAGDTNGSYNPSKTLPCEIRQTRKDKIDQELVVCTLKWYLNNPQKAVHLFVNKSLYFWSPWFGPLANGTMNRNPWKSIHPLKGMTQNEDSFQLLMGPVGKSISWIWVIGGLCLLFYGFLVLYKLRAIEKFLGVVAISIVFSSWLVTLISIGDHRFRLPIMTASLFLQAVGIKTLFTRGKSQLVAPLN